MFCGLEFYDGSPELSGHSLKVEDSASFVASFIAKQRYPPTNGDRRRVTLQRRVTFLLGMVPCLTEIRTYWEVRAIRLWLDICL